MKLITFLTLQTGFNWTSMMPTLIDYGVKILGAILALIIGRWLIKWVVKWINTAMDRQSIEPTLIRYIGASVAILLNVGLILAILGFFGFETTTFAALLAGAGLAIGTAWGGLLKNFAAGAFIVVLRPFKVGDFIQAGGVIGTVKEVGMFVTTIESMDSVINYVGNDKVFSDNIQNYSQNPYRRVDLKAQLNHSVSPMEAREKLKAALVKIPNVMSEPAPDVEILEFTPMGPVLAVRPYVNNTHYWQVYFDTNKAIVETFVAAGYPVPEQHFQVKTKAA
jgi:small conductance mechanosensitive channel